MTVHTLARYPAHIGLGAKMHVLPEFTGDMSWYEAYGEQHGGDGAEGRLVSMHRFTEPWDSWEMHPAGDELVLCTAGAITLIQEQVDGSQLEIKLGPGEYAINAPGVWHTADIEGSATAVFITAGLGTELRPR